MGAGDGMAGGGKFERAMRSFDRAIVLALVCLMRAMVALSTLKLAWTIAREVVASPFFQLQEDRLLEIFGLFLLVLIGVELLETIKAYLRDNAVHVEIVLEVALIAIARKVIVLNLAKYDGSSILAIAALLLALAVAFHLERRARPRAGPPQ